MNGFWFWILLLMVGTALMCDGFSSKTFLPDLAGPKHYMAVYSSVRMKRKQTIILSHDTAVIHHKEDIRLPMKSRKLLKDNSYTKRNNKKSDAGSLHLEDYGPTDPVPNSKASINPGPIQHGTPVLPYIPKPTPPAPDHP